MKTKTITINVPAAIEIGKFRLLDIFDNELVYNSPNFGKKVKKDGYILHSGKGMVSTIFFNRDLGTTSIHAHITLKELESFVKAARKAEKKFRKAGKKRGDKRVAFWRHLSPELSFFFDEGKP